MADEENQNEEGTEKSGGMMKMVMFGGIGLVLLAVGVFAGPAIMNMISPPEVEEAAADEGPSSGPAIYTSLHPPLVVNFKDAAGDSHFMQITMEVMAREQGVINSVREHVAVIRNALILLYSGVVYEEITTREGKEKMLADGLDEINKVMTDMTGAGDVEAVFFTALVIQ
jgi:flagellar FliL protein